MNWEGILSMAIPLLVVISFAQNTRVEIKDVQPVQRFEQVISGHVAELNGKYKFRVSEVTYQPGGMLATTIMLVLASASSWPVSLPT
jgi:hypothetical protein